MKFDARAALAEVRGEPSPRAIHAIRAISPGPNSTSSTNSTAPAPKSETAPVPAPAPPRPTIPAGFTIFATTDCPEGRAEARAWIKAKGLTRQDVKGRIIGGQACLVALRPLWIASSPDPAAQP